MALCIVLKPNGSLVMFAHKQKGYKALLMDCWVGCFAFAPIKEHCACTAKKDD